MKYPCDEPPNWQKKWITETEYLSQIFLSLCVVKIDIKRKETKFNNTHMDLAKQMQASAITQVLHKRIVLFQSPRYDSKTQIQL